MDDMHQVLLDAVKHNQTLIESLGTKTRKDIDKCKTDVIKLKYYIYTLAGIVLIMLGKPEWLAVLL